MKTGKALFKPLVTTTLFISLLNSCSKEDNLSSNETNGKTVAVFNPNLVYRTMIDQEGNIYKTINIGNQTWMAENLRTTKYRNGSKISLIENNSEWTTTFIGAYCNYNNTRNIDSIATLGRLYNWYAITDNKNICPEGWRVPSEEDWTILAEYLGGENIAGDKLKQELWEGLSDNSSGFTAVPSGIRNFNDGSYDGIFDFGYSGFSIYWSTNESLPNHQYVYSLGSNVSALNKSSFNKKNGLTIRCIKN